MFLVTRSHPIKTIAVLQKSRSLESRELPAMNLETCLGAGVPVFFIGCTISLIMIEQSAG